MVREIVQGNGIIQTFAAKVPIPIKVPMSNKNAQVQRDVSPRHRTHLNELLEIQKNLVSRVFHYFKHFWREIEMSKRREKGPLPNFFLILYLFTGWFLQFTL